MANVSFAIAWRPARCRPNSNRISSRRDNRWKRLWRRISDSLKTLDPTLVEAAGRAASKMRYQVNRLEKRAAQAELRRTEILSRHAAQIENALYPQQVSSGARN